jgi:hypothetical protein
MRRFALLLLVTSLAACGLGNDGAGDGQPSYECTPDEGLDLYERRIAPLLQDDRPSSCNQCHLSGVDLSVFVQSTPCGTMACMVEQGLVNLDSPADSLVLAWIDRAVPMGGITEDTIATEHAAMLEWIGMTSACGEEVCAPVDNPCGSPAQEVVECEVPPGSGEETRPVQDAGDCSDLTLETVWQEKVYGWRGRCYPCHFDSFDEDFDDAPPWIVTGECNLGSLATFRNAQDAGYLDPVDPMASLLLTKPLDESLGGVDHGGGPKMHSIDEPAYQDFVYFLQRYSECNASTD